MRAQSCLGIACLALLSGVDQDPPGTPELYFGQDTPGDTPAVFAPGVISKKGRFEQFLLFSPNGRGLTFGVTNSTWTEFSLYDMEMEDGRWTEPVAAPFQGGNPIALTAAFSFGMGRAFFTSSLQPHPPVDIWMSQRSDSGWSDPTKLGPPISSEANEFEVSISRSGTLYFSSNREGGLGDLDLYRAPLVDEAYPTVENLGSPINTASGDDLPYIAPDESYLIFASDRPGGLGERDLYVSFQVKGAWTEARNLGPRVNTEYWDIYPSVSPDGKYLFFSRRKSWQSAEDSDIYWVSAGLIDRLEKAVTPR